MGGYQRRYDNQPRGNPETDEGKEQKSGLIILQRSKDLMQYLYTSWVKYPRSEKPGFVADYKQCLFQFLIYIITAQKKYFKKTTLQDADIQLELLRLFNDLSYDMRFIDEKRYKHDLHIRYYIRYMDDIIILWPNKNELHQIQAEIERFLDEKLHLELNKKTCIRPAWLPVTFVGAQITPKAIRMRKSTRKRMFRRMKYIRGLFETGRITFEKVNNTMQSYFGLIGTFTARNLLRKVIDGFSFRIIKHDNSTG